jgi:hypothetical protein
MYHKIEYVKKDRQLCIIYNDIIGVKYSLSISMTNIFHHKSWPDTFNRKKSMVVDFDIFLWMLLNTSSPQYYTTRKKINSTSYNWQKKRAKFMNIMY